MTTGWPGTEQEAPATAFRTKTGARRDSPESESMVAGLDAAERTAQGCQFPSWERCWDLIEQPPAIVQAG